MMVVPLIPLTAKGIVEQPVTPRPCFNQPNLAVVEKARARLLHPLLLQFQLQLQLQLQVRPRLRSRYRPRRRCRSGRRQRCHDPCERGRRSGCETWKQNKAWAEATEIERNRIGLRPPTSLAWKSSRKFQTTKSILYPHSLPTH